MLPYELICQKDSTLRKFYGLYGHVRTSNMISITWLKNFTVIFLLWLAGTYHVNLSSLKLKTVSLSHEIVRSMYSKRLKSKSTDSNSIDKPSNTTTPKTYSWHFMYKRISNTFPPIHVCIQRSMNSYHLEFKVPSSVKHRNFRRQKMLTTVALIRRISLLVTGWLDFKGTIVSKNATSSFL